MGRLFKQFCPQGHDKLVVGITVGRSCKTCSQSNGHAKYRADRLYIRDKSLRRLYGISLAAYNQTVLAQNFRCTMRRRHMSEFKRILNVDHDHKTGKNRDLLCARCNTALGKVEDPVFMAMADEYLKKHGSNSVR